MRSRTNFAVALSLLLLVAFAAGPALAELPVASSGEPNELVLRSPESRAAGWQAGLVKFMAAHGNLPEDQKAAVRRLAELALPAEFPDHLAQDQKDRLTGYLAELDSAVPFHTYLQVLRSFDDELRVWLVDNGVTTADQAAIPFCNCTSNADCSAGYLCLNTSCVHEGGTTHTGVCLRPPPPPPPPA